jgi:putative ABC transport system permease protein
VVVKQLRMMLNKDLGFTHNDILSVGMIQRIPYINNPEEMNKLRETQYKNYQFVKNELISNPYIASFTQGGSPVKVGIMPLKIKGGKDDFKSYNNLPVTASYLKLFDLQLSEGRFFDEKKDYGRNNRIVINQAAKKSFGITDISNVRILSQDPRDNEGSEIIGVVRDFNYEHLAVKPTPLIMFVINSAEMDFIIRFNKGQSQKGLQFVRQLFEKVNPGQSFSYSFLSDDIANLYQKEKRTSIIYILFAIVSLLISSIGLFTIARYETLVRTKEIGIRKVNGARISEILSMLNQDFIKWVVIAFIITTPIAWYAMHKWLENFAYKTELSWWIFALAGLLAFVVALLTVSWQSWRAASRNPVEALRYE